MIHWKTSSFCRFDSPQCVRVGLDGDDILVGDSKNPGVILRFDKDEWAAFLAGTKDGEFDLPGQVG